MVLRNQTTEKIESIDVALNGTDPSAEIDLKGMTACALYLPTGAPTGAYVIQASNSAGGTFSDTDVTVTFSAADTWVKIPPADTCGFRFIKLKPPSSVTTKTLILNARQV